jgi:hypothetical protein
MKLELENGKYTIIRHDDGGMECLRYGEPWRELNGDKLFGAMLDMIIEHQERIKAIRKETKMLVDNYDFVRKERLMKKNEMRDRSNL